jgi:hypothetical protein
MERRDFLRGALALFGAAAVGASLATGAEAAPLKPVTDLPPTPEPEAVTSEATTPDADGQYYYYRRPRRFRRRVYRRRPIYYRRPRRYYRPRRVYYYRPRYRRIWW